MAYEISLRGAQHGAVQAEAGETLLHVLQRAGCAPEAPCGGNGTCGKCRVLITDGEGTREVRACQTIVSENLTVTLPEKTAGERILTEGCIEKVAMAPVREGALLAFDIGTTTVVCYLLSGETGEELASASMLNPQSPYGADVISRIQYALRDEQGTLTTCIRAGMTDLIRRVCAEAGVAPERVGVISVVGNPCMQQLFLGISPENLAKIPFAPVLTRAETQEAAPILPICPNALLLTVPDISGYVGGDTMGCVLATGLYDAKEPTLMVDIGTNGEMVLAANGRMAACSTAAGPALEGAKIRCGMRGAAGAIDHVKLENGKLQRHRRRQAEGHLRLRPDRRGRRDARDRRDQPPRPRADGGEVPGIRRPADGGERRADVPPCRGGLDLPDRYPRGAACQGRDRRGHSDAGGAARAGDPRHSDGAACRCVRQLHQPGQRLRDQSDPGRTARQDPRGRQCSGQRREDDGVQQQRAGARGRADPENRIPGAGIPAGFPA